MLGPGQAHCYAIVYSSPFPAVRFVSVSTDSGRPSQGYGDQRGVNTRALEELFNMAEERREVGYTYEIQVRTISVCTDGDIIL